MKIPVLNDLADEAQYSSLSNLEQSGTTVLRVRNINGFQPSWGIQIGKTGQERSEIKVLSSGAVSGTSLTVTAATSYEHAADSPVYAVKWDKLIFKRSTVGTAGTATAMAGGTLTITPDSDYTIYDDTSAAITYAYKVSYFNSVTMEESFDSDWITPGGYSWYSLGKIRERISEKAKRIGINPGTSLIDDSINAYLEKMNAVAVDVNEDYALGTVDVAFTATTGLGTITSSDFLYPVRSWITSDGINFYAATKQKVNDYLPDEIFTNTHPYIDFQGDTVFEVKPADVAGTARFVYQKLFTRLVNDGDEVPMYMRNHTEGFVDYGYAQSLKDDNRFDLAKAEEQKALAAVSDFKVKIAPRIRTSQTQINIAEPVSGDDGDY